MAEYEFFDPKIIVNVNATDYLIESVDCPFYAIFGGRNLIGMTIGEFMSNSAITYDRKERLYVRHGDDRFRQETVYEFDHLGLMLWTYSHQLIVPTVITHAHQ